MNKAGRIFLAFVIFIITSSAIILPCFASSSDSELSFDNVKPVDFTSWADVPEDYKALGEAYLDLFSDGTDPIFKNLSDIPISWLKLVNDITPVISPLDGLYYLLDKKEVKAVQVDPSGTPKGIDAWKNRRIPSRTFKERLEATNDDYTPKNASGKMTYRTDKQNQLVPHFTNQYGPTFYENGFTAVGGGDDIYLVGFYFDGEKYYYSKYQYHLYFESEEVWMEDRDEIDYVKKTLYEDVWSNMDGSPDNILDENKHIKLLDFIDFPYIYIHLHPAGGDAMWFRYFKNYTDYVTCENYSQYAWSGGYYNSFDTTYTTEISTYNSYIHFTSTHDTDCNCNADVGYIASLSPIKMVYDVDTSKIPDDAVITVGGDNIYNYYITNPDTGESSTINEYITNNYTYITNNNGGEGSGSGGTVGGNVTVGGEIAVGGEVGVDINVSVPDININVNNNGAGGTGVTPNPDDYLGDSEVDLTSYYDKAVEDASGVRQFLGAFFDFLPAELLGLLCLLVAVAICCRIFGR